MSFNLNGLTAWADEISSGLVKKTVLEASTIKGKLVTVKYGLKGSSVKLNTIATTPFIVAACGGFTNSGSTALNQSTMNICDIQLVQSWNTCTLRDYWYSWEQENKFNDEGSLGTFEEVFYANVLESNHKELDKLAWQGASSSPKYAATTGNLTQCDGFLQSAYANSASTAANLTLTALTVANALVVVETIKSNIPAEVIDNCNLYMSPADFQTYLTAVVNEYKYNATLFDVKALTEFRHPTSLGLNIVRTNGLQGVASGRFIATPKDNAVLGISDESDLQLNTWYEKKDDVVFNTMKLRMGTAYFFPEFVVRVG